jgi:hypothetical protein
MEFIENLKLMSSNLTPNNTCLYVDNKLDEDGELLISIEDDKQFHKGLYLNITQLIQLKDYLELIITENNEQ